VIETSPSTFVTDDGRVTVLIATELMLMFPVTVEQEERASRSL
jgi:hypothetical protein